MAAALLIQMLLAMPAALRMTAEASQWLQLDASICTAHENASATDGDGPIIRANLIEARCADDLIRRFANGNEW